MKKICYSDRSRNEAGQYLENQQRKEKPAMAPKVVFLVVLAALPILGFVCRNPFQAPPSQTSTSNTSAPTAWKEYRNASAGYSVRIPSDWNIRDILNDGTVIGINKGPVPSRDVIDSIRVEVKENLKSLSVEEFYRQPYEVNLYEDAKGGIESMTINGRSAMRFKDVIGLVNYEIVVIPIGTRMFEIQLSEPPDNKTIFEHILETLEAG